MIVLAYQLNVLIVPTLAPIAVWAWQSRDSDLFRAVLAGFNAYLLSEGWTLALAPVLDPQTIGMTVVAGLAVGLFAGIRPARRATEPTIVEALRPARLVTGGEPRSTERGFDLRLRGTSPRAAVRGP